MVNFRSDFLLIAAMAPVANSRIIGANTISMHGARAPDKQFGEHCPKNNDIWEVVPRGLTGIGLQQMHDLGTIMKEAYIPVQGTNLTIHHKFVDDVLDPTQLVVHAANAMHCHQSALAMGHGFPSKDCSLTGYAYNAPVPYDVLDRQGRQYT